MLVARTSYNTSWCGSPLCLRNKEPQINYILVHAKSPLRKTPIMNMTISFLSNEQMLVPTRQGLKTKSKNMQRSREFIGLFVSM